MARKGILGTKLGRTQVVDESNSSTRPVKAGPNVVTHPRTPERDGYSAVQLGSAATAHGKSTSRWSCVSTLAAGVNPRRYLAELRLDDSMPRPSTSGWARADRVEIFADGSYVDVTGTSSKGFAGTMKRHGFAVRAPAGAQAVHRRPGSIGGCATPARCTKGTWMAGRMGNDRVTVLTFCA